MAETVPSEREAWSFTATADRVFHWIACALFLVFALGGARTYAHEEPGLAVVVTVVCVAVAELCAWAALRTGVTVDGYGVTTRTYRTVRLAWDNIDRFETDFAQSRFAGWGWLIELYTVAVLKDGKVVRLAIPSARHVLVDALTADLASSRLASRGYPT